MGLDYETTEEETEGGCSTWEGEQGDSGWPLPPIRHLVLPHFSGPLMLARHLQPITALGLSVTRWGWEGSQRSRQPTGNRDWMRRSEAEFDVLFTLSPRTCASS